MQSHPSTSEPAGTVLIYPIFSVFKNLLPANSCGDNSQMRINLTGRELFKITSHIKTLIALYPASLSVLAIDADISICFLPKKPNIRFMRKHAT